jgi:Protein of unknown function (DUF3060)
VQQRHHQSVRPIQGQRDSRARALCRPTASGWRNNVTVENADTITVSGDKNKVTYLSGAPKITDRGRDTIFVGNS